jgi:hypothetical protein
MNAANGHDAWPEAEQAVLGALLIGAPFADVARILGAEHFTRADAVLIYRAIAALASAGRATDVRTVAELLKQTGHFKAAGGDATLSELARNTPFAAHAVDYARAVRDCADSLRAKRLTEELSGTELLEALQRLAAGRAPLDTPPAPAIRLRHIADIVAERREPLWLGGLHKVLEREVLAVLAGSRNTFKSFIAHHWAMLAAVSGEPVLILSAEGAGLDRRTDAWMRTHAPALDLPSLKLYAVERALNLNAAATLAALGEAVSAASCKPALAVIDTFSKFAPGLDENDNAAVALYLATVGGWLRETYGCTGLLVAHSGHGDTSRPRGASTLMANPDAEYIVQRPGATAMTVTVSRERFKDSPALRPLAYRAETVPLERLDRHGEPVTSLALHDTEPLPPEKAAPSGKNQAAILTALQEWKRQRPDAEIVSSVELRAIAQAQQVPPKRLPEITAGLEKLGWLQPCVGGHRFLPEPST